MSFLRCLFMWCRGGAHATYPVGFSQRNTQVGTDPYSALTTSSVDCGTYRCTFCHLVCSDTLLRNILDNNELFDRLRQGDETAFDEIFRAWYPSLVRSAESIARSQAVAEEIVQDVMLELWRRRESLARDTSPQAYLFQSTRNRALNHVRHERVERKVEPVLAVRSDIDASAPAELVEEEIEVALRRAVSELPERCREVFELSRTSGLKYSEIAAVLGISVKTVEAQMGKALRSLRVKLAKWLPESDTL